MKQQTLPLKAQNDLSKVLYHFQKVGANYLYGRKAALLADEMGVGKTLQSLAAIRPDEGAVVICPAFLVLNWKREAERFRPDLRIIESDLSQRFPKPGEILITAYSRLPPTEAEIEKAAEPAESEEQAERGFSFPKWSGNRPSAPFTLILDEAHYVKSSQSQRSQRVRALASVASRVWLLTGTPILNRPPELWALLQAAQWQGKKVFGSWENMVRVFGGRKKHFGGYDWNGVVLPEATERLKGFMLRRTRREVLSELPDKTYRRLEVTIASKGLLGQSFSYLDGWSDAKVEEESAPAGSLFSARRELAEAKHEALGSLLDEYETAAEPVVVFSAHTALVQGLGLRKGWHVVTGATPMEARERAVRSFQDDPRVIGIAGTIGAMGTGVTLTRACHVVFVDRAFTVAENLQAEDRLCRIGQTRGVLVTVLVADHPIDRRVEAILIRKQKLLIAAGLDTRELPADPDAREASDDGEIPF